MFSLPPRNEKSGNRARKLKQVSNWTSTESRITLDLRKFMSNILSNIVDSSTCSWFTCNFRQSIQERTNYKLILHKFHLVHSWIRFAISPTRWGETRLLNKQNANTTNQVFMFQNSVSVNSSILLNRENKKCCGFTS